VNAYVETGFAVVALLVIAVAIILPLIGLALWGASRSRTDQDAYPSVGLPLVLVAAIFSLVSSILVMNCLMGGWHDTMFLVYTSVILLITVACALMACRLLRIPYYVGLVFLLPPVLECVLWLAGSEDPEFVLIVVLDLICVVWLLISWMNRDRMFRRQEAT
jgi:hypothetical protein